MAEVVIPPSIVPDEESVELLDDGTAVFRPALAAGIVQRQQFSPPRWRVTQRWRGLRDSDLGRMMSLVHLMSGRLNTVRVAVGTRPRGSAAITECVQNNTFASGTTGWTAGAEASLSAVDGSLRIKRISNVGGITAYAYPSSVTNVPYYAYVWRAIISAIGGNANPGVSYSGTVVGIAGYDTALTPGVRTTTFYAPTAAGGVYLDNVTPNVYGASGKGDYFDVSWCSCTRTLLVDNGPNYGLYSESIDNAYWQKVGASVSAEAWTDPFGVSYADSLIENTANSEHYATGTSARTTQAGRGGVWGFFRSGASARNITLVLYAHATPSDGVVAIFDIASNIKTYFEDVGNGWFYCGAFCDLDTSSELQAVYMLTDSNPSTSYLGNGSGSVYMSRAGFGMTTLPVRPVYTGAANVPSGTLQSGSALYVKGGGISTAGYLLPGDFVEINGELKRVTAALDTDARGCGLLQFEPPMFTPPADNTPVIANYPMGKFILADSPRWSNRYGKYADLELTFESIYEP
jgi:hypothetical protein